MLWIILQAKKKKKGKGKKKDKKETKKPAGKHESA